MLEVSAGTNRNIDGYQYNNRIKKLVLLDSNYEMLDVARRKVKEKLLTGAHLPEISFVHGDAANLSTFEDDSFDTIIDTFGLCSCKDPSSVIKEMIRCVKPTGRIIFLQHGLSQIPFIDHILNKFSHEHAKRWGCWWNRDISSLISNSNLNVLYESKSCLSTVTIVIAEKRT